MCTINIDTIKVDAFGEKLIGMLNQSSMSIMTSIGHRTGLFDTMSKLEPSTSEQIAEAANLNERYVREWLGAMTAGEFITYNPETSAYYLPAEHAACLTREASPNNISVFAQYIPLMGDVEDKIINCFKYGGGVGYSEFKRFHEVMVEDSFQTVVSGLFDHILPLVTGIMERLKEGISVLDVGCGRGVALTKMAKEFPNSKFLGYDLSEEAIEFAKAEAEAQNLTNIQFKVRDLTTFDEDSNEQFDFITSFDAIHDQARPDRVLKGIYNSLRNDGIYLMQDIAGSTDLHKNLDHPVGPFLYTVSTMHCMTVSLAQGGAGLGTMWGEEKAVEMLNDAGFSNVEIKKLDHDFQNNFYVINK